MSQYLLLSLLVAAAPQTSAELSEQIFSIFKDQGICELSFEDCVLRGIYTMLGIVCIVNTAIVSTILVTRHRRTINKDSSDLPTSKNIAVGRLTMVLTACCIIETFVHHRDLPLSFIQCKCTDEDKLLYVFCQLQTSLLVVSATSLLGALAWFNRVYHGVTFIFYTVSCHTISNFLAMFFISSPRQIMCNSPMQRVTTLFIMYSAMLLGVQIFRKQHNMQMCKEDDANMPEEGKTVTEQSDMRGDKAKFPFEDQVEHDSAKIDHSDSQCDGDDDEFGEETNFREKPFRFSPKYSVSRKKHPFSQKFGTDAFLPCVVLMRKKSRVSPILTNISNIGLGATKPPSRHAHRRASLGVIKERNVGGEEASWARLSQRRRTSLPTTFHSTRKQAVMSSVLVESSVIAELHSTLNELSAASSNNPDVEQYIGRLQKLLKPYKTENLRPSQVVWLHDSISSTSDGSDDEGTFRGNRINSKRLSRRAEWSNQDGSVWTTTTSATGLPSQDPGPVKSKRIPKIQKTPSNTPHDSRCNSPVCGKDINLTRRRTIHSIGPLHSPGRSQTFFSQEELNTNNCDPKEARKTFPSSDYESCDNLLTDGSECDSRGHSERSSPLATRGQPQDGVQQTSRRSNVEESEPMSKIRMLITEPTIDEGSEEEEHVADSDSCCSESESTHSCQSSVNELAIPKTEDQGLATARDCFIGDEYKGELLEQVHNWNFPIFELAADTHCVLSQMAYKLFDDTGLFESFKIPRKAFVNYMRALENGYRDIPYHNRIHASDVLHGCWFLTTQQIPGFKEVSPLFSSDSSDSDSGTSHTQVNTAGNGSLAQAIPALELMALYLAAAMHDYDHPGRTNAFLVETRHPLAMLYNDRSVLENHHASASWELLHSRDDDMFDFLVNLNVAEWKRLRFLIVEAILATDLKKHFELMGRFSSKLSRRNDTSSEAAEPLRHEACLKWTADEDRLLVCQMVIKLADISGPTKVRDLHVTWTQAICQEFFMQGDEERRLNSPVSPFMDREQPQVAQLQRTFIKNLIAPLVCKMHRAGILAGYSMNDEEREDEENILGLSEDGMTSCKTQSLLKEQLADNLRYWHSILQQEMDGHDEMKQVFKCAHEVVLEHKSITSSAKEDLVTGISADKTLNNNPLSNCDITDKQEKHIVTKPKEEKDHHKRETKIPGFTLNFLSHSVAKSEPGITSNILCNKVDRNRSKLPRISTKNS